jgi:diguanylate cyclase (GGDEF)-like protein/PAS domain S-box-containing protein
MDKRKHKLLFVNYVPDNAQPILEKLRVASDVFELVYVQGFDKNLEDLSSNDVDVFLLDLCQADDQGEDILKFQKHIMTTPTVVLTQNESLGVSALRLGALDYLTKDRTDVDALLRLLRHAAECGKTKSALLESEARYRLLLESVTDYVYTVQIENGHPVATSHGPGCFAITGYTPEEYSANPFLWYLMVHEEDRQAVKAQAEAILSRKSAYPLEHRIIHKDGRVLWIRNTPVPHIDQQGHLVAYDGLVSDITDRKQAEEKLIHDAFHDALTGLPNRALFMDRLQRAITTFRRRIGTPYYAVLFCDIDRFKVINDSLGHPIGDQLLRIVGRKLIDCVRPGDTVARLGGDEFAVLLENIGDLSHAKDVTERVKRVFSTPITVRGNDIFTSLSIGIAIGTERYERPEQALRDADIAMYEAKSRGNASYEVFDAKMHANILDRMQLETDLRGAVDRKEFILYYQPIIDLKAQRVTGFEALVRWNHPKRGLIYPLEFIPLAEETGLINHIGDWILHEACRELKRLQVQNPLEPPLTMSVNISIKQFAQQDLAGKVSGFLSETEVDPHTLALEITESMIMANVDAAAETMNRLREMGIKLHIDDFGTGHSSLSYLHRFPVNALKIDRSFIGKLTAEGANTEIITSIISLAKSLHVDVIAEGVEMYHQLSNIKELNCGYCQGFLIARPMAEDEVDAWIHEQHQLV